MGAELNKKQMLETEGTMVFFPIKRNIQPWVGMCTVILVGLPLSACETAKRFAPPGFVKYEDLEKGIPVDPAIQARIEEAPKVEKPRYPVLSELPQEKPKPTARALQVNQETSLLAQHDRISRDIAAARSQAENEFGLDTEGTADELRPGEASELSLAGQALGDEIKENLSVVDEETKDPLPEPIDTSAAPVPEEPF